MLVLGFVFSSVAGYMAGIVGSSNNPISGVTIATVIVSSLILLKLLGNYEITATLGPIAVMYLAALICSAAAIAGDNMQDLKCGYILGATPWRQQLFQVIGVVSAAAVIPLILQLLDNQYGIGRPSPNPEAVSSSFLAAPQAGLMMSLTEGIFGSGIKWSFIILGSILAVGFIILDKIQEKRNSNFRFPVLAIAIGIYLPFGLSIPIFIGGLLSWVVKKRSSSFSKEDQQKCRNVGLLVASGLITGEALMGVIIALMAGVGFVIPFINNFSYSSSLGLVAIAIIIFYQYKSPLSIKNINK
jgi:putative OPT family oligopeptide transporter